MHNVISFKQVIQGKQPAFLVLAVSLIMKSCVRFQIRDWRCLKPVQATFIASAFASLAPTHPASAGRASKVKIGRFLWNCVIFFFLCHLLLSRCFGAFQAESLSIPSSFGRGLQAGIFKTKLIISISIAGNNLKCT